jgi:glycine hydroxymethyltransferase
MIAQAEQADGEISYWKTASEALRDLGRRQILLERSVINLIASDNALPNLHLDSPPYPGNIIQEGIAGARPFAGARFHDEIERLAANIAKKIFSADHANLQPHSCSQANQAVYHALLKPGDSVLALGFRAGGHLTHGLNVNFSGRHYSFRFYGLGADGLIDYDAAHALAQEQSPKLIVCGSSSYPRWYDGERLRRIADACSARLMFDLSHEAGLVAGGVLPNIVPYADAVTMSLDKTLRGPFGGLILCRSELADSIDRAVHPGTQSSFPIRKLTESAVALLASQTPEFALYARSAVANARALAISLENRGVRLVTGGSDKHYIVADVARCYGISGTEAERKLERIGILSNRQTLPQDVRGSSGLRLGTAWIASRGYTEPDARLLADLIDDALRAGRPEADLQRDIEALVTRERANDVWNPCI